MPIVTATDNTECQAFCPVVRIGSPDPLTGQRVLLPPTPTPCGSKGGWRHTLAWGGGSGWGSGPNSDDWTETLVLCIL
jgi:hypothetical protein